MSTHSTTNPLYSIVQSMFFLVLLHLVFAYLRMLQNKKKQQKQKQQNYMCHGSHLNLADLPQIIIVLFININSKFLYWSPKPVKIQAVFQQGIIEC